MDRRLTITLIVLLVLAVLAQGHTAMDIDDSITIAVVPIVNLTDDAKDVWRLYSVLQGSASKFPKIS